MGFQGEASILNGCRALMLLGSKFILAIVRLPIKKIIAIVALEPAAIVTLQLAIDFEVWVLDWGPGEGGFAPIQTQRKCQELPEFNGAAPNRRNESAACLRFSPHWELDRYTKEKSRLTGIERTGLRVATLLLQAELGCSEYVRAALPHHLF